MAGPLTASARRRLKKRLLNPFQPPEDFPADKTDLYGLKWIGPVMRGNLRANNINSWDELEEYFRTHNKHENAELLRTALVNTRATICVASDRGWRDFQINHVYRVRPVNWFAYNSILYYARHAFDEEAVAHLPKYLKPQRAYLGFPTGCPPHH